VFSQARLSAILIALMRINYEQ